MAKTLLMTDSITETYSKTSKAIREVDLTQKHIIRKSLVDIMKQSFFHGSSAFGTNFIA